MRYFFDLNDQIDETGTDLPGKDMVPHEARGLILAVAANAAETVHTIRLAVRDQNDRQVFRASLRLDGHWVGD